MNILKTFNLVVAFALELAMLVSLGYWGFYGENNIFIKFLLGIGTPLLAAVLWGIFAAPMSQYRLSLVPRLVFELAVFGIAALALYKSGQPALAIAFGVVAIISQTMAMIWKQ